MASATKRISRENSPAPGVPVREVPVDGDFPMSLSREATVRWMGHPPGGEPRLTVGGHSLLPAPTLNVDLQVANPMSTSPGELLAGGFGVIFATVLANQLVREQTQASELVVGVAFILSQGGPGLDPVLREIRCDLEARVAGIDLAQLSQLGEQAMRRSIDSLAMNADAISISLTISLVGESPAGPAPGLRLTSPAAPGVQGDFGPASAPAIANGLIA